jgi:hypothetical protein
VSGTLERERLEFCTGVSRSRCKCANYGKGPFLDKLPFNCLLSAHGETRSFPGGASNGNNESVISTDRRNTYLKQRSWSDGHEAKVSSCWVYRGAKCGTLGALEEAHLRRVLKAYTAYYNETRPHLGIQKDAPDGRPIERHGVIAADAVLGGLHHRYARI